MKILFAHFVTIALLSLNILYSQSITETKLIANDGDRGDFFGWSVSLSGEYAIIGAPFDDDNGNRSGAAYIYKRDGINWLVQAKLVPTDGEEEDLFGWSVSISGDYAIIGAQREDTKGESSGSAYIFARENGIWIEKAKITARDGDENDRFGFSVSIDSNYAIIGAIGSNGNVNYSGSAYIFKRQRANWIEQAKFNASDGSEHDDFGRTVSISGEYAIVGAYWDDDNGFNSGSAYIFKRERENWIEQAKLIASDGSEWDQFGKAVEISGDYAVIGANRDDDGETESGSAYVFKLIGMNWIEQNKLTATERDSIVFFGTSVSIDEDLICIGATRDEENGIRSGSAYVFKRNGTSFIEQYKLTPSDGKPWDNFGISVSLDQNYLIVGAYSSYGNTLSSGSAYVYSDFFPVSINDKISNIPTKFRLAQNYPNPFNPTTSITYYIPITSNVELAIYDQLGEKIKTLIKAKQSTGIYQVEWNGKNETGIQVASGIYFYTLRADESMETRKMILIK